MSLQRLAAVAQSVQQAGEQFFDTLVEQLASLLGVPRAEVWEVTDPDAIAPAGGCHLGSRPTDLSRPGAHGS